MKGGTQMSCCLTEMLHDSRLRERATGLVPVPAMHGNANVAEAPRQQGWHHWHPHLSDAINAHLLGCMLVKYLVHNLDLSVVIARPKSAHLHRDSALAQQGLLSEKHQAPTEARIGSKCVPQNASDELRWAQVSNEASMYGDAGNAAGAHRQGSRPNDSPVRGRASWLAD